MKAKENRSKQVGSGNEVPPEKRFVLIYFAQKGMPESEADRFFRHYDAKGWKSSAGTKLHNWKTLACDWIWCKNFGFKMK